MADRERLRRQVSKLGSERLRSTTEIQVEGEELQNQRTRFGQRRSPWKNCSIKQALR